MDVNGEPHPIGSKSPSLRGLWQRIKSSDATPEVSLPGVVRARSVLECNPGLRENVGDLLEKLSCNGSFDLLNRIGAMPKEKGLKVYQ